MIACGQGTDGEMESMTAIPAGHQAVKEVYEKIVLYS